MPDDMSLTNFSLDDLQQLVRATYVAAARELAVLEAELAEVQGRRDVLADRVERLVLALDVAPATLNAKVDVVASAPPRARGKESASAPQPPQPASTEGERARVGRPHGQLWHDVYAVLSKQQRAIQAASLMKKLVALGYDDDDATQNKLIKSLGRWVKAGRLERPGRGLFRLPPSGNSQASAKPAKGRAKPAKGRAKRATAAAAPMSATSAAPQVDGPTLWSLVAQLAKHGPVGSSDLMNTLAADGWAVGTEGEKTAVTNQLDAWVTAGKLERFEGGVYGLVVGAAEPVDGD